MNTKIAYKFTSFGRRVRIVPLLLAGTMLTACASDDGLGDMLGFGTEANGSVAQNDLRSTIPYDVEITGIDPQEEKLIAALDGVSTARRLQSRPTASRAGLQRRAEDDVERFQAVLRSNGFYDGQITFDIHEQENAGTSDAPRSADEPSDDDESQDDAIEGQSAEDGLTPETDQPKPLVLTYNIDVGTPYLIEAVNLVTTYPDKVIERTATDQELEKTRLQIGQRATAEPIILGEQYGVDILRERGYPLAKAGKRTVMVDTAKKTITINYAFEAGPPAKFGDITVNGAKEVDPDFIAGYHSWEQGEQYHPDQVRTTRRDLAQSNLFDSVIVKVAGPVNDNGEIPVEIDVVERKMRSVGGGVDFSTADGPGASAFWEHRNLFGERQMGQKQKVTKLTE